MSRRNRTTTERECPRCHASGEGVEFASADANCICKICQSKSSGKYVSTDATWRPGEVTGHRRGIQRRHGSDNRE